MKKLFWFIVFSYLSTGFVQGQLTVQNGLNAQQLANILAGPDITPFNAVVFDTFSFQTGSFNYIGNDLGLNDGVILSTGDVMAAVGPNTSSNTTSGLQSSNAVDSLLSAIANRGIADLTFLEFEFEAPGNEISFNYIFLSEEYNEYVFRAFNDAFAFTISGPGIVGEENLALIPNANVPITISNVNNNLNWQYYVDNDSGTVNIQYDGFTTLLTAQKTGLQPCGIYKLTLKIADGANQLFDSGVMIQANSLTSNSITAVASTYSTDTTALEGCTPASYTFDLGFPTAQDLNIPIRLGGTALNGVDYELVDSIITIPAGQSSSTLIINALSDGLVEGQETIELYYRRSTSFCIAEDTIRLYIDDATPLSYTTTGTNLNCNGDQSGSIMINIAGGSAPYSVNYSDISTGIIQSIPAATLPIPNLDAATYALQVYDQYGCTADAIVAGGLFNAGQTFLPDGTGVSYTNDINISGFNGGQTLTSINQINSICATLEHSYAGDLGIELIAPNGASIQLKGVGNTGSGVYTCNLGEPVASGPTDAWSTSNLTAGVGYQYCWTTTPIYSTMTSIIAPTNPGPPPTYTYTTLAGNSYTDYYLPAGSYTPRQSFYGLLGAPLNGNWRLKVTDYYPQDNGYLFDWSISLNAALPDSIITLTELSKPTITTTTSSATCGFSDGSIDLSISGLFPPYTYLWNTGSTNQDLSAIPASIYTVTVTDNNNCSFEHIVNLSNRGIPNPTAVLTHETCSNTNSGGIDLSIGAGSFNYTWSNGMNTQDISNLAPNNYSVTIDDGSCFGYATYTIHSAAALTLSNSITHENCGDREGEINISIVGGLAPYQYLWSNGASSQNISDLQQGTYEVTLTDANSCVITKLFNVINLVGDCIPSCDLSIVNALPTNEACGNSMGSIDISTYTTGGSIFYQWSNGATTEDISNLSVGVYSLTVEDTRGCLQSETYTITNQTNGLTFSEIIVYSEICGDSTGRLTPIVYGGVQPYSFLWSNGSTNRNLSSLTSGNYTCTVTDATGCSTHLTTFLDNDADFSLLYSNVLDATCNDSTGSIDILLPIGFDYNFIWSNGATTEDLRAVPSGVYSCTITDDDTGCELRIPSFIVNNQSGSLQFDYIDIDHQACDNGLGEIDLMVSGGTQPYTYNWTTGANTTSIDSLFTGIYEATITDSAGCNINTGPLTVGSTNGSLVIDAITVFDENCNNNTGAINLEVSGNTGALSFLWNTGASSKNISNLSAGTYTCTISDALGCTIYQTIQVNNSTGSLYVPNTLITHENCSQSNGALDLIILGGTMPINYLWSNGGNTQDLSALTNGTYTCTITDAQGCQLIKTSIIQNNTGTLSASVFSLSNEICGDSTGAINLSILGGTLPLSYLWSNGDTTQNIMNLNRGNYTCTITDNSSCALISGPYFIDNSSSLVEDSTILIHESCTNQNGSIDLSISGGAAPYSYQWSNGNTTEDLSNLAAGSYSCTITDIDGCSLIITKNITNSSGGLSIVTSQIIDELCSNNQGAINLTTIGGTSPYTYQWSNGNTTENIVNLSSGNYTLTLSDINNCAITTTYTVANNAGTFQISSPSITNEQCGDNQGSINLNLINGTTPYTYQWSNSATTQNISNLSAGFYTQTITDNNNCIIIHSVQIQNTAGSLLVLSDSIIDETCNNNNGSINLSITGGTAPYSYQWSNGATSQNLSNLNGGTYSCVITDQTGCSINYVSQINDLGGNLQIANITTIDNNCQHANGAILASVTGGNEPYNFTWGTSVSNPCGYYTLNMYSPFPRGWGFLSTTPLIKIYINGLYYSAYNIPYDPYYLTTGSSNYFRTASFLVCQGDSIRLDFEGSAYAKTYELLDGQGNIVFEKTNPNTFGPLSQSNYIGIVNSFFQGQGTNYLTGLEGGNYTLTVTDTNGCSITQSTYLNTGNDSLMLSSLLVDESCGQQDGIIDLSLQGSINPSYSWSNGSITEDLNGLSEGTYMVTISDRYGCSITDTYSILNNANGIEVIDTIITMDSCLNNQGAINLAIIGGQAPYSFEWSNGRVTKDILGLSSGIYTVTITDFTACKRVEQYYVDNIVNGILASSNRTNISCTTNLGAIDLSLAGGTAPYTYLWSNGDTTEDITGLALGTYTCSISDATGCTYIWQDTINQIPSSLFIPNITVIKKPCNTVTTIGIGGEIYVSAAGGTPPYSYIWSNGTTTPDLINVINGIYSITITDSIGCQLVDTIHLEAREPLFIPDTIIIPDVCNSGQGSIDLTVLGGTKAYLWSNGATTQDITNLSAGNYNLTISSLSSTGIVVCEQEVNLSVPSSSGTLSLDTIIYTDEICAQSDGFIDVSISGGTLPISYLWSNGDTTQDLNALSMGLFSVSITDSIGCTIISPPIDINNISYGLGISGAFITDEQCGLDGAINIVPSGGSPPYSYSWSNGDTTQDLSNISGGVYYLTLTEANACQFVDSFVVNFGLNALSIGTQIINPTCGQSNGAISLAVSGGSPPYSYLWFNGNTSSSVSGLPTGNYTVTISDMNACIVTLPITIVDTTSLVNITSTDTTSTSCSSCSDGAIDLSLNTSGAPYTFLWDNGMTTEDLNNLMAGTYHVTISNADGCALDTSFTVNTSVGVEHIPSLIQAKVYPNPSDGKFVLEFNSPLTEALTIHIYNNLGQVVYTRKLDGMGLDRIIQLQLDNPVSGIYLLQLTSEEKYFTQKIIIQ